MRHCLDIEEQYNMQYALLRLVVSIYWELGMEYMPSWSPFAGSQPPRCCPCGKEAKNHFRKPSAAVVKHYGLDVAFETEVASRSAAKNL